MTVTAGAASSKSCGARLCFLLARCAPYLSLFAIDFAAGAVNPLLAYMVASNDEFADISAAGAAAVAVGNIFSGYLAGCLSIRFVMTGWMVLAAIANAGTALAPSFGVLLLCRVVANLADNWSLTQTLIDPNGSSAAVTGRATAAVLAGRVAGGVLGGLVTHAAGPSFTCFLCAGVLLLCAALDFAVIPTSTVRAQALMMADAEDEAARKKDSELTNENEEDMVSLTLGTTATTSVRSERDAERGLPTDSRGITTTNNSHGGDDDDDDVGGTDGTTDSDGTPPKALHGKGDGAGSSEEQEEEEDESDVEEENEASGLLAHALGERDVQGPELRALAVAASGTVGFWAHTAVLVINGLICGALNTTVPSTLKNVFLTTPEFVQYTLAADTACRSFASAVLLPLLSVRVAEPWRSGLLSLLLAGGLALVLVVPQPLWPFVVVNSLAFSLQSVHQSAALAGMNAYIVSAARQFRGLIKGFAFAIFVGGIAVGSAVADRIEDSAGREWVWAPAIALAVSCALLNRFSPFDADKAIASQ